MEFNSKWYTLGEIYASCVTYILASVLVIIGRDRTTGILVNVESTISRSFDTW